MTSDKSRATEQRLNALINQLNDAALGLQTARTSGIQVFSSATQAAITGLSVNLVSGNGYIFEAFVHLTADSSVSPAYLAMGGTASISTIRAFMQSIGNNGAAVFKPQDTFGNNSSPAPVNFALNSGSDYLVVIRGHLTCSGNGTLVVNGATGGADGYTTHIRSVLRCWQTAT